jgi:ADP-heptose:LPS heptosyltransferase
MEKTTASRSEFADCLVYQTEGERPLAQIASLVEGAILVITPDTSLVHFASAMRTPVIGLYTQQLQATKEWLPFRVPYRIVTAPVGEPTSHIRAETLIQITDEFIASLLGSGQPAISKRL